MQNLWCFPSSPHIPFFTAVFRGQSRPGVHGCDPCRLPVGLSVSTNHEASSGGLQVKILLAGEKGRVGKKNVSISFGANQIEPNLMSLLAVSPQIIILWNSEKPPPNRNKWPPMPVPLIVTDGRRKVSGAASKSSERQHDKLLLRLFIRPGLSVSRAPSLWSFFITYIAIYSLLARPTSPTIHVAFCFHRCQALWLSLPGSVCLVLSHFSWTPQDEIFAALLVIPATQRDSVPHASQTTRSLR